MSDVLHLLQSLYLAELRRPISRDGLAPQPQSRKHRVWSKVDPIEITDLQRWRNVWLWSDTHFWHKNIINYANRPFRNVDEMNQRMFEQYTQLVKDEDLVIWGGDVALGSKTKTSELLQQLPGTKIIVLGNHDIHKNRPIIFEDTTVCSLVYFNVNGIPYVVTHYPMNNLPFPYINIHGHIHDSISPIPNHLNICVEQSYVDYTPTHLDALHAIAKTMLTSIGD